MYSIRKYRNGMRGYGRNLERYYKYVYFGVIRGKDVAIVSNRILIFSGRDTVNIVDEVKVPLHIIDRNIRMGKGYQPVEKTSVMQAFELSNGYRSGVIYDVYTVVYG